MAGRRAREIYGAHFVEGPVLEDHESRLGLLLTLAASRSAGPARWRELDEPTSVQVLVLLVSGPAS
jgi:hypothetical protein